MDYKLAILYPEVEKAGSLDNALNTIFKQIGSVVETVADEATDKLPLYYSRLEKRNKSSQVLIAAEEKLYMADFWRDGVCLANAAVGDLNELALIIDFWLNHDVSTNTFAEKYSAVHVEKKAIAYDENREVEYAWNKILEQESKSELYDFIMLAIQDDVLNKLFPFTSLYTLCFSRCTGYPYDTDDLPDVTPIRFANMALPGYRSIKKDDQMLAKKTLFIITKNKSEFLAEAYADDALEIVKKHLPYDIKPAIKGTAKNLR